MQPSFSSWLKLNLKIGLLSFGSVSRVVLYEEAVVEQEKWLTPGEFQEVLTLAQLLPGPNLVNLAACLGFRVLGATSAVLGAITLAVPGAVLAVLVSVWVPLTGASIRELFRGFAIVAFLLIGGFLYRLWKGVHELPEKSLLRTIMILLIVSASLCGVPVLQLVAVGAPVCLLVEFIA